MKKQGMNTGEEEISSWSALQYLQPFHVLAFVICVQGKKKKVGPSPAAMKLAAKTAASGAAAKRAPAAASAPKAASHPSGKQMYAHVRSVDWHN
jgi:hypothetical protein